MKKFTMIACICALCFALGGCASGASSSTDSGSAEAASSGESSQIADGIYDIKIKADSSMVNVVDSQLTVEDGKYIVTMSLNGEGFSRLYKGTAEQAAKAKDDDIYDYRLNKDQKYTFDFVVDALDEETDIALFGQRRDTWYDHVLVFKSPEDGPLSGRDAALVSDGEGMQPEAGAHTVEATLRGGSGRATIENPIELEVASNGAITATIVWSSENYDLMVVDDKEYRPVNESGNSTFKIPVASLDRELSFSAETTAMSEPHMIDYTVTFNPGTLK